MGLLGLLNRKSTPTKKSLPAAAAPATAPKAAPAARRKKPAGQVIDGYDIDQPLPDDAPLAVRLAQTLRKDPDKLKRLFVSWAESEEGDSHRAR